MSNLKSTEQKTTVNKSAVERSLESLIRKIAKQVSKEYFEEFLADEVYKISRSIVRAEIQDDHRENNKCTAHDAESLLKYLQERDWCFGKFYEDVTPELAKKQAEEIYKA